MEVAELGRDSFSPCSAVDDKAILIFADDGLEPCLEFVELGLDPFLSCSPVAEFLFADVGLTSFVVTAISLFDDVGLDPSSLFLAEFGLERGALLLAEHGLDPFSSFLAVDDKATLLSADFGLDPSSISVLADVGLDPGLPSSKIGLIPFVADVGVGD